MKKYPKTIYVKCENAGTQDEYLQTETDPSEFSDDGTVAVYQLVETKKRRTETHLE